jgi:hypothetical protein
MTTTASRPAHRTLREIFAAPLVVGILSGVGLIAALVGDGIWDAVSWAALAVPVVLFVVYIRRRKKR